MDRIRIPIRLIREDFFRVQFHLSMPKVMMFSNTAMTVDRAAKVRNTKNRAPQSRPMGISLKILGSVTKIRLGPESGATPKEKQAGKMMNPAISATRVSRMPTRTASPVRRYSRPI